MALTAYDKLKHATRCWLLRQLSTCEQTVAVLSQSMDRRLTLRERMGVKIHLWTCAWCLWYIEHLRIIRDAAQLKAADSSDLNIGPTLSQDARERIKARLTLGNQ